MTRRHGIEQQAAPPLVPPVSPDDVEHHRRKVYQSYEAFLRRRLEALDQQRPSQWHRDYRNLDAYLRSVAPMRQRLKQMLGFWSEPEQRPPLEAANREMLFHDATFTAYRFELEIIGGLSTYAVELVPAVSGPRAALLLQHGYGGTPELICGLCASANDADYSYRSLGIRAVRRGFHVIAPLHPTSYGSRDDVSLAPPPGFEYQTPCYGKNRLHRLATLGGGTLFGLDMMASSRAVDWLARHADVATDRIGMYGLSQGGQTALYLPALDLRVAASVCSAYFNRRLAKLIGPHRARTYVDSHEEDKFFSDVVSCFSDCDLVSLIAPRAFAVEAGEGDASVDFEQAVEAFAPARLHYDRLSVSDRVEFIAHQQGHVSGTRRALEFLEQYLRSPTPPQRQEPD